MRGGILLAFAGYATIAAAHIALSPDDVGAWASEAITAAAVAAAFVVLERGRPRDAARLTLLAVWLELHYSFVKEGLLFVPGLPALLALVVGTGLLAGGYDALLVAAVSAVTAPACAALGRALNGVPVAPTPLEAFTILTLALSLLAVGALLHLALRSFADVVTEAQGSERRLADLVSAVPDGIVALDPEGRVESVNPAAAQVLGVSAADAAGRPFRDVAAAMAEPGAAPPEAPGGPTGVRRLRRPDGTVADAEITTRPTDRPDGRSGTLVMLRDVTERRRAEERQGDLQRQLLHAQKLEAVGQFAGGVAHDFNNLLQALVGNLDLARLTLGDDTAAAPYLDEIGVASNRASALVQQLLAFTRRQASEPRTVELAAVVRGIEPLLRRLVPSDIVIAMDAPKGLGLVRVDPGQFEQVLVNLVVNARDAMPTGGRLTVGVAAREVDELEAAMLPDLTPGRHLELTVADTGTGMPPEVQARIFEPFFTTKRDGKGSGLGLATVYGIVKQADGHIRVESREGAGTTFHVLLRCVDGEEAVTPETDRAPGPPPRGTERLLVVDDHAQVRAVTVRTLRSLGYEVLEAEDGREALELSAGLATPVDLVITDVVMPNLGGKDLAEALRALAPGLPILFTSGYAEDALAHRGVVGEGVHLLSKPFRPEQLARAVRQLLDAAKAP